MKNKYISTLTVLLFFTAPILRAQESDSIPISRQQHNKILKTLEIAIPAVMVTYGAISIESDGLKMLDYSTRDELLEDNYMLYNKLDDYFQFSPAIAAFSMKLCGVQNIHKLSDMFILYALSNALETGIVFMTKSITSRERPDGTNYHSFPSGHTATAFVAAEFLHQEYGGKSAWISVGGYGMASLIGVSRIYNNRHWVSDVIAGAGIGILSTKAVYWLYPHLQGIFGCREKKFQAIIFPEYSGGSLSLNFSCTF